MPLTARLKRRYLPITAAVTATLVLTITFSIFFSSFATVTPPPIIKDSNFWSSYYDGSFYESAYAKATSEQKAELDKIIADQGGFGKWIRPVLIAIGDLPKDQPRLTAEQAGELYDSKEISALDWGDSRNRALETEFNKIAGAPDFFGGSGIERAIYYLNDDRSEAIVLFFPGDVRHIVLNADGTQTTLPIGNQQLPVNPGPSTSPDGTPQTRPQPTLTDMPMPTPT